MKICKVKPDYSKCCECVDEQISYNESISCSECPPFSGVYELISVCTGGFLKGDYAIVQKDGHIEKVPLNRIYDVKEKPMSKEECLEILESMRKEGFF